MPPQRKNLSAPARPRGAGYVRVSTGKQQMSPAAQEDKIRALAGLQDLDLVTVVTDRESAKEGSIKTRPGLLEILELARCGQVSRIIVAKLDRLTRSVVDLGTLLSVLDKQGVSLASATDTWMDTGSAAGRMILNIITSVAQWEREAIGERTATVLQFKRAHGDAYNHTPYGSVRKGARLLPAPAEQAVIRRVKRMRAAGVTLRAIALRLDREKVATKKPGGQWHASTVANVLRLAA